MKKFISLSIFTLTILFVTQQQASAWYNIRFKAGIDFSWKSGGNTWFCRMFTGAPYPAEYLQRPPTGNPYPPPQYYQAPAPTPTPAKENDAAGAAQNTARLASYPTYGYQPSYPQSYYGIQPVGYWYPHNFHYYSVPSYWYGY